MKYPRTEREDRPGPKNGNQRLYLKMKLISNILKSVLLFLFLLGMASCENGPVFEKEGDCTPKVQFVFKKHRQALHSQPDRVADAFYSTVGSVHLFVYDLETGNLVFEKIENTDNLLSAADLKLGTSADRCFLPIDVNPGRYRLVAWCGLDESDHNNAFYLNDGSRAGYARCDVKLADEATAVHAEKYQALYHGTVRDVVIDFKADQAQIIPVELTKNTNDIAVWVQHNTKTFDKDEYEVVYTDANGTMHFDDNSLLGDNRLEFRPHTKSVLTSQTEYNNNLVEAGALVAHLSTSRLLSSHSDDARLEVRNREGKAVFSIPFIKYVTEMQTLTDDHQYYLDCEDTYNCSFYLTGENGTWSPAMIIINNWVKVPDQKEEF